MNMTGFTNCCTGAIIYGFTTATNKKDAKIDLYKCLDYNLKNGRDWNMDGHISAVTRDGNQETSYGEIFREIGFVVDGPYRSQRHSNTTFHYTISRIKLMKWFNSFKKEMVEIEKKQEKTEKSNLSFVNKLTKEINTVLENA